MASAREVHSLASVAAQKDESLKALQLSEEAMLLYHEENDVAGFSEIQSMRFIIFKHLFEKTEDKKFLILARNSAHIAVELAELSGDKTALGHPYLNLGKALEIENKYGDAALYYEQALSNFINNPGPIHDKNAIRADVKSHLAYAQYKTGAKSAYDRMLQAIHELETANDVPSFEKNVWLSGAHMRSAEMLRIDNPGKSMEHLLKAKEILDYDQAQILRKRQWDKLNKLIKSTNK